MFHCFLSGSSHLGNVYPHSFWDAIGIRGKFLPLDTIGHCRGYRVWNVLSPSKSINELTCPVGSSAPPSTGDVSFQPMGNILLRQVMSLGEDWRISLAKRPSGMRGTAQT